MAEPDTALQDVRAAVEADAILFDAVMDVQVDDDTLVVLTDSTVPRAFVRNLLARHWRGPLDVFCATGLMTGACEEL